MTTIYAISLGGIVHNPSQTDENNCAAALTEINTILSGHGSRRTLQAGDPRLRIRSTGLGDLTVTLLPSYFINSCMIAVEHLASPIGVDEYDGIGTVVLGEDRNKVIALAELIKPALAKVSWDPLTKTDEEDTFYLSVSWQQVTDHFYYAQELFCQLQEKETQVEKIILQKKASV